jgi:hypothetical protein
MVVSWKVEYLEYLDRLDRLDVFVPSRTINKDVAASGIKANTY